MNRAVLNGTPLIALSIIGHTNLLKLLCGEVVVDTIKPFDSYLGFYN